MNSFDCCVIAGDGDGPSLSSSADVVARKSHRCYECGEDIERGARYRKESGLWDGRFDEFKICLPCIAVRDRLACNGWVYGNIWSEIIEHLFPTLTAGGPCIEGMRPEGKRKLFDEFFHWYCEDGHKERSWWQRQEERADAIKESLKCPQNS